MENGIPTVRPCGRPEREPEPWRDRSGRLYLELRASAKRLVRRGYGASVTETDLEDIYNSAWASSLSSLASRASAMSDDEVRSYVLTAVAHAAARELRRRGRRPTAPLDLASEIIDAGEPLPEEHFASREAAALVRDLLASLPLRRRTVLTLRYGWGLEPEEVCGLVEGLSPRTYRREVERGVRQLAESMRKAEAGDWCETRQGLIAAHIAGTAEESERAQAESHLAHCGACRSLASRLRQGLLGLEVAGAATAIGGVSQAFAGHTASVQGPFERALALPAQVRDGVTSLVGRGSDLEAATAPLAASGGTRGAGTAAATAVAAKLAGFGTAAKVASACIATGAAATVCVAAAGIAPLPAMPDRHQGRGAEQLVEQKIGATVALEVPQQIRDQELSPPEGAGDAAFQPPRDSDASAGEPATQDVAAASTASRPREPIESVATRPAEVPSVELGASAVSSTSQAKPERQGVSPNGGGGGGGAEFGP